jgi:hypothetical protein
MNSFDLQALEADKDIYSSDKETENREDEREQL